MRLLAIRHAIAAEAAEFTGGDWARPLTERGKRRMQSVARGLVCALSPMGLILASPLLRAQETARIVADAYGDVPVETLDALAPGSSPEAVVTELRARTLPDTVALVGHEPDLSALVTWLLAGVSRPCIAFRKGGACLLELHEGIGPARATLSFALPPRFARRLR